MIVDVDVPIDQTRRHDPAARIEYVGGRGRRNVWLDGADPTPCDGDVGDSIDAGRRVEDAPAPDEEVVARSARQRSAGERHCAGGGEKFAARRHGRVILLKSACRTDQIGDRQAAHDWS